MPSPFEYATAVANSKALGPILVGRSEKGICWLSLALGMDEQRAQMAEQMGRNQGREVPAKKRPELAALAGREARAVAKAADAGEHFPALPLDLRGTEFQISVWEGLLALGEGHATATYSELTEALGLRKTASRAVGTAVGANPVSLLVPCHLVARRDGGLGGYRWGLEAKRHLLASLPVFNGLSLS